MRNYIKSEFYRIIHRKYYQVTVLLFVVFSIVVNLFFKFLGTKITEPFFTSMDFLLIFLFASPIILLIIQDIILGDEIKHKTLNNVIVNGISRDKIIFSKIISILAFFMLFSIIVIGVHILISIVLFGINEEGFKFINQYFLVCLSAVPLWIGLISFYIIFSVTIQNQVIVSLIALTYIYIVSYITRVIAYLQPKLTFLYILQPLSILRSLIDIIEMRRALEMDGYCVIAIFPVLIGFGLFTISTILLITIFRKKDF